MKAALRRVICVLLVLCMGLLIPVQATAATSLPSGVYLTQEGTSTCTLCATAMMIRARMYLNGNSQWSSVTESGIRSVAWINGTGLRWGFTYECNGDSITVSHAASAGISVSGLKRILDAHPEGIVLYCGNLPHAVFATDYEGDTFYCAEPIGNQSGKRIPLADSWLGHEYGSQATILNNVTAYWYVSSYTTSGSSATEPEIQPECSCSEAYAGEYVCTAENSLNIRSGHGTGYAAIGSIPGGAVVTVTKANGAWAHVTYGGVSGVVSMDYLREKGTTEPETQPETQPETEPETQPETGPETEPESQPEPTPECACTGAYAGAYVCIAGGSLNIRGGHGTGYAVLGSIPSGAVVTVTKGDGKWAHVTYGGVSGYVSMDYFTRKGSPKTALNITRQPQAASAMDGERIQLSVGAEGEGLSYQWQYSKTGTGGWMNSSESGNRTAQLSILAVAEDDGLYYRCCVTDAHGTVRYSNAALVTVAVEAVPASQPATGWVWDGADWFYLTEEGTMVTGIQVIHGMTLSFGPDGRWEGVAPNDAAPWTGGPEALRHFVRSNLAACGWPGMWNHFELRGFDICVAECGVGAIGAEVTAASLQLLLGVLSREAEA